MVREPGADPITGSFYERAEQSFDVEAPTQFAAYVKSQLANSIVFRGQLRRTFIDDEEYFNDHYKFD